VTGDTRSLAWDNSDRAAIALPANTHYQAGLGDQLVIKGDPAIISHVHVRNGVVALDCHGGAVFGRDRHIDVTLPGKHTFRTFEVMGTGNMDLSGLSQPEVALQVTGSGSITADARVAKLDMNVSGSGTVEAKGQTDKLNVEISGSGKIRAGELETKDANLDVSGLGNIEVAPQGALSVDLSGAGAIYLKKEPRSIQSDISGAGRIIHPDGESQGNSRHSRHARRNGPDLDRIIREALANAHRPERDALDAATVKLEQNQDVMDAATAHLRQRIRAQVARALEKQEWN
jgi:hypothetical protein